MKLYRGLFYWIYIIFSTYQKKEKRFILLVNCKVLRYVKCLLQLSSWYAILTWFFNKKSWSLGSWDSRMICQTPFPTWDWDPVCAYKGKNSFLVFYYASIWMFELIKLSSVPFGILLWFVCLVLNFSQNNNHCVYGCYDLMRMQPENSYKFLDL